MSGPFRVIASSFPSLSLAARVRFMRINTGEGLSTKVLSSAFLGYIAYYSYQYTCIFIMLAKLHFNPRVGSTEEQGQLVNRQIGTDVKHLTGNHDVESPMRVTGSHL